MSNQIFCIYPSNIASWNGTDFGLPSIVKESVTRFFDLSHTNDLEVWPISNLNYPGNSYNNDSSPNKSCVNKCPWTQTSTRTELVSWFSFISQSQLYFV